MEINVAQVMSKVINPANITSILQMVSGMFIYVYTSMKFKLPHFNHIQTLQLVSSFFCRPWKNTYKGEAVQVTSPFPIVNVVLIQILKCQHCPDPQTCLSERKILLNDFKEYLLLIGSVQLFSTWVWRKELLFLSLPFLYVNKTHLHIPHRSMYTHK